jgi:hypothetical protein
MKLFDKIEIPKNKKYLASDYELICGSTKTSTIECRNLIEHWFDQLPPDNLNEFLGRFKSKSTEHHVGALFELFVYNLCVSLGFKTIKNAESKIPDFKIITSKNETIFIECTIAGDSISKASAHKNSERLYQKLNSENLSYWVKIQIEQAGQHPIPEGKLLRIIKSKINLLNYEEELQKAKIQNFSKEELISLDSWSIVLSFRAKPKEILLTSNDNVGIFSGGLMPIESTKYLTQALNEKRTSKYEVNEMPYIIAINSLEIGLTEYEILATLVGNSEKGTGFFGMNKNTSVSGVLLAKRLNSWNVKEPSLAFYHNPWAKRPINENILNLNQTKIELETGKYKLIRIPGIDGENLVKTMI